MTTKVLSEIKHYQSSAAVDGSLLFILSDTSTPGNIQAVKIASKLQSIDEILNPNNASTQNESTLKSAAIDLKCLALFLGEFQSQFGRRAASARTAPSHIVEYRQRIEAKWLSIGMGLHILCLNILRNYKNQQWLDQNAECIYYSLMILKNLCIGQSEVNINKIINDTQNELLLIMMEIMNGAMSWIEGMICCDLLRFLLIYGQGMGPWCALMDSHGLNVFKLLISSCCNCMKLPYFYETLKPYQSEIVQMHEPINEDIKTPQDAAAGPTYMRSGFSSQNEVTKSLHAMAVHCRIQTLRALLMIAIKHQNEHEFVTKLLNPIPVIYWKRILQISTLTMRQGRQCFPPSVTSIDIIATVIGHKEIAEKLVADHEVLETLLIGMRARSSTSEYNYREIVMILYFIISHHRILPSKYHHDAVLCLMDILEIEWKNFSIIMVEPFKTLHTLIVECLKTLFSVPFWKREHHDDFLCAICFEEYDWPHTLQCGHSLCYVCLSALLGSNTTARSGRFNCWFRRHDIRYNHCPQCRQQIHGVFDRDDKKSAFILDRKLQQKMYSDPIVVDPESTFSAFKGTECEFWKHLSSNHEIIKNEANSIEHEVMKREFSTFCDFMERETMIQTKKERNAQILKAREMKVVGNKFFGQKQYEDAISEYKNALRTCPLFQMDRVTYYSNMALCYQRSGDNVNAFRVALNGLVLNPNHIKLNNTALSAFDKLLRPQSVDDKEREEEEEEEEEQKNDDDEENDDKKRSPFYPNIHSKAMSIGDDNALCLKYRVYDVIQYQYLWECEIRYLYKMADLNEDSHQYLNGLRENDPFLKRLNNLSEKIQNYRPLNFEEYQYRNFIGTICNILGEIDSVFRAEYEGKNEEEMKGIDLKDAVRTVLEAAAKEEKGVFWKRFVNEELLIQMVNRWNIDKELENESKIDNDNGDNVQRESEVECMCMNKEIDIMTSPIYRWEQMDFGMESKTDGNSDCVKAM